MSSELNSNQIRGYKSTLARDNVSEEAKDHARQVLEENDAGYNKTSDKQYTGDASDEQYTEDTSDEHSNRVLGGYKSTLKRPNVSDKAREHAAEVLEEAGVNPNEV